MSRGLSLEINHSLIFHEGAIPVLVSPQVLRSRQLGQLDLVKLIKMREGWRIEVGEVKSSQLGTEVSQRNQKARLKAASSFLASLFGAQVKLTNLVG